jgi:hypothetical protein
MQRGKERGGVDCGWSGGIGGKYWNLRRVVEGVARGEGGAVEWRQIILELLRYCWVRMNGVCKDVALTRWRRELRRGYSGGENSVWEMDSRWFGVFWQAYRLAGMCWVDLTGCNYLAECLP